MWRLRFALSVLLALLPSWLKVPLYRWLFGYRIGRGVRSSSLSSSAFVEA